MRSPIVQQLAHDYLKLQTTPAGAGLPRRPFGRAAEALSIVTLGGWHSVARVAMDKVDESESIRLMHAAIDEGINFFDNAWDYHDGYAEEVMGRALAMDGKRDKVFLMTKNCERDYEGSLRDLEDSLRRLQTDHLDLWMFHECNYDNDPDWIFERGAIRAAMEARAAGKVRYIGFTGHKDPRIHTKMLRKPHAWDASLMPINIMDAHYRSFLNEVVPICHEMGAAPIGMKGFGGGWPNGRILEKMGLDPKELLRFNLSQPIVSQVVGIRDMEQLKLAVSVARNFQPMSSEEQDALLHSVRTEAGDGRYESFKSTNEHDGAHHRKQHNFALA
ncbi:MAG TPA: aldo/keto reductase [Bryobacteraceae bacterium]|nr:aldo/keto reductase [Bryobacteraceae bacterium]